MKKEIKFTVVVTLVLLSGIFMFTGACEAAETLPVDYHPAIDAYDGWRLGIQCWSFRRFTFYEAVDKTASLGLGWIEAFPKQQLCKEKPELKFYHDMAPEIREQVKAKLKSAGVRVVNYGVVGLPNDEAKCRQAFEFAKDMGIETIVMEPKPEMLDMIFNLAKEYKIKVAIHNHPAPSKYWHPDKVLWALKGGKSACNKAAMPKDRTRELRRNIWLNFMVLLYFVCDVLMAKISHLLVIERQHIRID